MVTPMEIREVKTSGELKAFVYFPRSLYRGNPNWVPPMYRNVFNTFSPEKQRWNQAYMRFGWLDFVDDPAVCAALLGKVEEWARENGCSAVHGPLGFTDMDQAGMLVEGFDEPSTMATIYNHAYYPQYLEQLGYVKDTDWVEYEITVPSKPDPRIAKLAEIILRRENLRLIKFGSKKELLPYVKKLFALFNESYRNLYGYIPLNEQQVQDYTRQNFDFIRPEFVPVVLNAADEMVAFGVTMPSLTRAMQKAGGSLFPFGFIYLLRALQKNDRADLYLIAVKPEYQGKGVNAVLINRINEVFIRHGIRKVESNPELEDNHRVQGQWKHFDTRQHKRRRCYIKHLS